MTTEERESIVKELKAYIDQKLEEKKYVESKNLGDLITNSLYVYVDGYHSHNVNIKWYE